MAYTMQQRGLALRPPEAVTAGAARPRSNLIWYTLQVAGVLGACALVVAGYLGTPAATAVFWHGFVLLAPLLCLVAPGVWRNVCPLATLNQVPRLVGRTPTRRLPIRLRRAAPFVSAGLLLLIVEVRPVLLDDSPVASATFIVALLGLALIGGLLFSGKSGWCTTFCPMLTVERFYGTSALLSARHAHCRPCTGCVRNCRDVQPAASFIDLHSGNREAALQVAVAGALPWLCVAFFRQSAASQASPTAALLHAAWILAFVAGGAAIGLLLLRVGQLTPYRIVSVHVVAMLHLYYWYSTSLGLRAVGIALPLPALLLLQAGLAALSLSWLRRAWQREHHFQAQRPAARMVRAAG